MASRGGKQGKKAARHKASGKYSKQRDRTEANKARRKAKLDAENNNRV